MLLFQWCRGSGIIICSSFWREHFGLSHNPLKLTWQNPAFFVGFISHPLEGLCLINTSKVFATHHLLINVKSLMWSTNVPSCGMSIWSKVHATTECGWVNVVLGEDGACRVLSIPHQCELFPVLPGRDLERYLHQLSPVATLHPMLFPCSAENTAQQLQSERLLQHPYQPLHPSRAFLVSRLAN